jgi:soluble lytic murein transglycosylase-like protein
MNAPADVMRWLTLAQTYASESAVLTTNEILAVIWNESSGNPKAENLSDPSFGLMGVSPLIARAFGGFAPGDISWHEDPNKNIAVGSGFLAHLKSAWSAKFPDYLWVAAYNEGETQLQHGAKDLAYVTGFQNHLQQISSE